MILVVLGLLLLYVVGHHLAAMIADQFDLHLRVSTELKIHRLIMTATMFYVLLMAIPFMPGVEIGITMLMVLGPSVCFLVYVSTVTALTLSYLIGQRIPARYCGRLFGFLGLRRAHDLMMILEPLSTDERRRFLLDHVPPGATGFVSRHRFIGLALLLNLPGNSLIGGGGGISMLAGMSGLFPIHGYLFTVALAVAPVPLIVYFS